MITRWARWTVKGLIGLCIPFQLLLAEQAPPPAIKKEGDALVVQGLNQSFKIPISTVVQELGLSSTDQFQQILAGTLSKRIAERRARQKSLKVIKHVKGDNGVPLKYVKEPKIVKMLDEPPKKLDPKMKKQIEDYMRQKKGELTKKLKKAAKPKIEKFRECTPDERGTSKTKTGEVKNPRLAKILEKDVLFINERMRVPNPKTTFGKYAEVIVLKPGLLHENLLAQSFDIKCLPFRFRATKRMNFKHYGDDALKNFDDDYLGTGVFAGSYAKKE